MAPRSALQTALEVMNRYAIYARVSTRDKGQEVEQQLPVLRQYVVDAGGQLFREFLDEESGGTDKRPAFQAMLLAAHQKKFDVLLFWSLDRFSREGVRKTLNHLHELKTSGVRFTSYTERFLDTTGPMADGVLALIAALANQRLVQISDATKRGLAAKKAKGVKLGRPTLAPEKVEQILKLREQNLSFRAISKETGVPVATIQGYLPRAAKSVKISSPDE